MQETSVMTNACHEAAKIFLRKGYIPESFDNEETFYKALRENFYTIESLIKDDWNDQDIKCFHELLTSIIPIQMCMVMNQKDVPLD